MLQDKLNIQKSNGEYPSLTLTQLHILEEEIDKYIKSNNEPPLNLAQQQMYEELQLVVIQHYLDQAHKCVEIATAKAKAKAKKKSYCCIM